MEGFRGEDAEFDREPVKVSEDWRDVLPGVRRSLAAEFCSYWSRFRTLLGGTGHHCSTQRGR